MGEYAYKRNAHYTYQDFVCTNGRSVHRGRCTSEEHMAYGASNARMKFNTDPGGDGHVRILKNDRR